MTDFESLAERVLAHCLEARSSADDDRILQVASSEQIKHIKENARPPQQGKNIKTILADATAIFSNRVRNDHPAFFGFIPSPASPISWVGDILNNSYNTHAGSWYQSSGPSAVEATLIAWFAEQCGMPEAANVGGCFVSGGSMANLLACTVARDQRLGSTWEERSRGRIYVSTQTHSSVAKGLRMLGFETSQIVKVACDCEFRMDATKLQEAVEIDVKAGSLPFLTVATFGATNTGSIDDIHTIRAVADRYDMWLHVDGAYGASIALSKGHKHLVSENGLDQADSISWDAHKWLFQTYSCSLVLVKDKKSLVDSFATSAEYIQDAAEGGIEMPNFWNYGMELTRPARAMKLWFFLQIVGLERVGEMVDRGFALAETAERELRRLIDWSVESSAKSGIVCFRFVPDRLEGQDQILDRLNQTISSKSIEENLAAPLTTKLNGRTVLRMCAIHPDLQDDGMVQIVEGLDKIARSLVAQIDL